VAVLISERRLGEKEMWKWGGSHLLALPPLMPSREEEDAMSTNNYGKAELGNPPPYEEKKVTC